MEKYDNTKVSRSKQKLQATLMRLMKTRAVGRITVSELCSEAHVNRTTFYKYYKNVDDLLEKIESQVFNDFKTYAEKLPLINDTDKFIHTCLELIKKNHGMAQVIFASGKYALARQIFALFRDQCDEYWTAKIGYSDRKILDKIYYFVANGMIGIAGRCTDGTMEFDVDELSDFLNSIINDGVNGLAKNAKSGK
jgi:AcrR family transcriptional regulator